MSKHKKARTVMVGGASYALAALDELQCLELKLILSSDISAINGQLRSDTEKDPNWERRARNALAAKKASKELLELQLKILKLRDSREHLETFYQVAQAHLSPDVFEMLQAHTQDKIGEKRT